MTSREDNGPPAKRRKMHKHLNFKEKIGKIYVDVYLGADARRADPLPGYESFFQEKLMAWSELNAAEHFVGCFNRLRSLSSGMAQLVHNAGKIVDIILDRVHPAAILSLEPLLDLLGWLCRDLQGDFVPYLEPIFGRLTEAVARGLHHEPEALQHVFSCEHALLKTLSRWLAPRFADVLRWTRGLRHNRVVHVRSLAAGGPAFLLRHLHARGKARTLREAVGEAVREAVQATAAPEAAHAAACLFAGSVRGPRRSLNSHAEPLLKLVLDSEALLGQEEAAADGSGKTTREPTSQADRAAHHHERHALVLRKTIGLILEGVHAEDAGPLWVALLSWAAARLDALEQGASDAAVESAAEALDLVGMAVEWRGGKKLADDAPAQGLLLRALGSDALLGAGRGAASPEQLAAQRTVLRLTRAVLRFRQGSSRDSAGAAFGVLAEAWAPSLLQRIAPELLLAFLGSLCKLSPEAHTAFFPYVTLPLFDTARDAAELADLAWGVMLDAAEAAEKLGRQGDIADALAERALRVLEGEDVNRDAAAWAALTVLRRTALQGADREAALRATERLWSSLSGGEADAARAQTLAEACGLRATLLEAPAALAACAAEAVAYALGRPRNAAALAAAADALERSTSVDAGARPGEDAMRAALRAVSPLALASERGALRVAAHRLLAAHEPPTGGSLLRALCALHATHAAGDHMTRDGAVIFQRVGAVAEQRLAPDWLAAALAGSLLGALRIPFSPLWNPATAALAKLLAGYPDAVWPLVLHELQGAQSSLLERAPIDEANEIDEELVADADEGAASEGDDEENAGSVADRTRPNDEEDDAAPCWWDVPRRRSELFAERVAATLEPGRATDVPTRLRHLLAALAATTGGVVERHAKDWVGLFLEYSAVGLSGRGAESAAEATDGASVSASSSPTPWRPLKAGMGRWRGGLREWLKMLGALGGLRGVPRSRDVLDRLLRLLRREEGAVQAEVLQTLRAFKPKGLAPYIPRLVDFTDDKKVAGQMAGFSLREGASAARADDEAPPLEAQHRGEVIPLLIAVLFPKMRKKSAALGGAARKKIMTYLAGAEPEELAPLLAFFLEPLQGVFAANLPRAPADLPPGPLTPLPGFTWALTRVDGAGWLAAIDVDELARVPTGVRHGLLDSFGDLLAFLGYRIQMYAPVLLAFAVALMEGTRKAAESGDASTIADEPTAAMDLEEEEAEAPDAQNAADLTASDPSSPPPGHTLNSRTRTMLKFLRRSAFRLVTQQLALFPLDEASLAFLWPRLMAELRASLPSLEAEASSGARVAAPLELAEILARGPGTKAGKKEPGTTHEGDGAEPQAAPFTAFLLADSVQVTDARAAGREDDESSTMATRLVNKQAAEEPVASATLSTGAALMDGVIDCLCHASSLNRTAAMRVLEAVIALPAEACDTILGARLEPLLRALQRIVVGYRPAKVPKGARGPRTEDLPKRALALLEALATRVRTLGLAAHLTSALVAVLNGALRRQRPGQGPLVTRALAVLAALWEGEHEALALSPSSSDAASLQACVKALQGAFAVFVPLAARLTGARDGVALARAATVVAGRLEPFAGPAGALAAAKLTELTALAIAELGEPDLDRRTACYLTLTRAEWARLARGASVAPAALVATRALTDLRAANADLGLRGAALEALEALIQALPKEEEICGAGAASPEGGAIASAEVAELPEEDGDDVEEEANEEEAEEDAEDKDDAALEASAAELTLEASPNDTPATEDTNGSTSLLLQLARGVLQRELVCGLTLDVSSVRADHLALLRSLGLALPRSFPGVAALAAPQSDESDFWLNAAHLQLHRRARAMLRLARALREPDAAARVGAGALLGIVAPLLFATLRDGSGLRALAETHTSRAIQAGATAEADAARANSVADAAAAALGALAALLPWKAYASLLDRALTELRRAPREGAAGDAAQRVALRAACAVLASFHFDVAAEPGAERALTKRALPALQRHIVVEGRDGAGGSVRAGVALAVVRALRRLPERVVRAEAPRLLQPVSNLLRDKAQGTRDDARKTLVAVLSELGPVYLPYALETVQEACPVKGMTAHVLGFTAHALVDGLVSRAEAETPVPKPGSKAWERKQRQLAEGDSQSSMDTLARILGECLPTLLPIIEADYWGEVAEAKEATLFARQYREARSTRGASLYGLLARCVRFGDHARALLGLVHAHVDDAATVTGRARLETLLKAFVSGVLLNRTVDPQSLCVFVYATLDEGLAVEEAAARAREAEAGVGEDASFVRRGAAADDAADALSVADRREPVLPSIDKAKEGGRKKMRPGAAGASPPHVELLVAATLRLLLGALRGGHLRPGDAAGAALLDPFAPLLARAALSRHAPVACDAVAILTLLLKSDLPGLIALGPRLCATALDLLQTRCRGLGDALALECLRLLSALLRDGAEFRPSPAQVGALLGRVFRDLDESAAHASSFALLQAVLARGTDAPEVHALMLRVREVVVRTHREEARRAAAQCLVRYLGALPADAKGAAKLLAEHVQFLLKNLAYEHESGRMAALSLLESLLAQLPAGQVGLWADTALLPLVTCLAGDSVAACRARAAGVLGALAAVSGKAWRLRALGFSQTWLQGADPRLHRAALQLAGVVVEAAADGLAGALGPLVGLATERVLAGVVADLEGDADEDEVNASELTAPDAWKTAYQALLLLEKTQRALPELLDAASPRAAAAWAAAARAMAHRHQWVERAAGRVLLAGLAPGQPETRALVLREAGAGAAGAAYLAGRFVAQLETPGPLDETLVQQAMRAVVLLVPDMHAADEAAGRLPKAAWLLESVADGSKAAQGDDEEASGSDASDADASDADETDQTLRSAPLQAARAGHSTTPAVNGPHRTLGSVLGRVAALAESTVRDRRVARLAALRCLAAAAARLGADRAVGYAPILYRPIVRATEPGGESAAARHDEEALALAHEVADHLRGLFGAQTAIRAAAAAEARIQRARTHRRAEQARRKLIEPAAAAAAKRGKRRRNKEAAARKIEAERRERNAGTGLVKKAPQRKKMRKAR